MSTALKARGLISTYVETSTQFTPHLSSSMESLWTCCGSRRGDRTSAHAYHYCNL